MLSDDEERSGQPPPLEQAAGSVSFTLDGPAAPAGQLEFRSGDRIRWVAHFREPPNGVRIAVVTVRRREPGWERAVSGAEIWLPHPRVRRYAGWIGPAAYDGPGEYVLRFVCGASVLAEGTFRIVDPEARPSGGLVH
ncbi:MAG TPA: hypothetical protein VNJ28_02970 [Candidatus Limnocylindrales bacterium]|nr:hypothetical protein [Candidatus Limnocylindrales bacterium]